MAKKQKKSALSDFEMAVIAMKHEPITVNVTIDGCEYAVEVKCHIDELTRSVVLEQTEEMYFADGVYNPNHGNSVLRFILFQLYTGLTFDNDLAVFEKFENTHSHKQIIDMMPNEYHRLIEDVQDKVSALKGVYCIPYEEKNVYTSAYYLIDGLSKLIDSADVVLQSVAKEVSKEDGASITDIINALKTMNAKDEKKLANAILEYRDSKQAKEKPEGTAKKAFRI